MNAQEVLQRAVKHHQEGRLAEASAIYQEILQKNPNHPDALHLSGVAALQLGQIEHAVDLMRRAIAINPRAEEYHNNFGEALRRMGRLAEATAEYRQAVALRGDYADAHLNLGNVLRLGGQLDEALAEYEIAARLRPDSAEAHNKVATAMKDLGRIGEALASFARAMKLEPGNPAWGSNYIYTMHLYSECTAEEMFAEELKWNDRYAQPLHHMIRPLGNDRSPHRRLKIGYVSPDFREHAVAMNALPLLREHDHKQIEVFCYADIARPDETTALFQSYSDGWREITGISDPAAAEMIRRDGIDILVDLTMHMAGNRLLIFACKPAPIQATFIAYPGGTGMDTIDYRLTDAYLDPPEAGDRFYAEQSMRLGHSFWCYDWQAMKLEQMPDVRTMPAATAGQITFGCLNNFCKINDRVLELWARVLMGVPQSRLILLGPRGEARRRVLAKLQVGGVEASRVEFLDRMPRRQYMESYNRIDIFLDTFPYNGHTTCLESLWMGVPVLTLAGTTTVSRGGRSILSNLGLAELVANEPDQYVQLAQSLAGDRERLQELRRTLRHRMTASPLMDARQFAAEVETAYREMWRIHCGKRA